MFGQVFSSPIPKPPQVPIIVYHLPAPTTFAPTPAAVVQDDAETPPFPLPQCSAIESNALPHRFMGSTLFGQAFFSAVTPAAPTPKPVAPPPPDAIVKVSSARIIASH
jgi:hypothetical protein